MAMQQPTDTPFGLQPNVAAGLAYLLGILGGIIMLVGGGTNGFVKWAAAQSITFWGLYIVVMIALPIIGGVLHMWGLFFLIARLWQLLGLIVWLATFITAFQGKELRLPVIADLTTRLFPGVA